MEKQVMKQLHFVKTDPAGNTTILVLDPIPAEERSRMARLLMAPASVSAEQVAFADAEPPRFCDMGICMMGGEFCGNAVRSAAAWKLFDRERWQPSVPGTERISFEISCTGIEHNVHCTVQQTGRSVFDVTAEMPLPLSVERIRMEMQEIWKARFSGITHYCCCGTFSAEEKANLVRAILNAYPVASREAAGVLFWDGTVLDPFVYVKDTDTLVNESSCGSGTAAVASCMAFRSQQSVHIDARQTGGMISGEAVWHNGKVEQLQIGGPVRITAEGIAYL